MEDNKCVLTKEEVEDVVNLLIDRRFDKIFNDCTSIEKKHKIAVDIIDSYASVLEKRYKRIKSVFNLGLILFGVSTLVNFISIVVNLMK